MAEFILNRPPKRRVRSSSSSTSSENSSIASPDQKKPKQDEVMTALNMAEGMASKLDEILAKVAKLDLISESVHKIERSIAKLEERTVALEDFQIYASKQIDDMRDTTSFLDERTDAQNTDLQKANVKIKELTNKQQNLEEKIKKYENEIEQLKTKDLYLEAYSRRENILFLNIKEDPRENTEEKLRAFLRDDLGYENYDEVEFQRIHRNPSSDRTKPRPILARFLRYKDCEDIMALGKNLKGTNYSMFTDLPQEIVRRRKVQMATYKKAKKNNIPASFSKAKPDKLYVRGKEWPPGQELIIH